MPHCVRLYATSGFIHSQFSGNHCNILLEQVQCFYLSISSDPEFNVITQTLDALFHALCVTVNSKLLKNLMLEFSVCEAGSHQRQLIWFCTVKCSSWKYFRMTGTGLMCWSWVWLLFWWVKYVQTRMTPRQAHTSAKPQQSIQVAPNHFCCIVFVLKTETVTV